MKKRILILCTVLAAFGLTAFGFMKWDKILTEPEKTSCRKAVYFDNYLESNVFQQAGLDLLYKVDSRFWATLTKEKLHNAISIIDMVPEKATESIESYQAVEVAVLHNEKDSIERGIMGDLLNTAQIKLLQTAGYTNNIYVKARCKKRMNGELVDYQLVYYISIIPEKEAEFVSGQEALINYLKENSRKETAIITKDNLKPGKVNFTVTKEGTISNVTLSSTSGYPSVDEKLVELISDMPGKWNPATNSKGEKVEQELVFFFGLEGC